MSTTRYMGEADKGDEVRHAHRRHLYEMSVNISG